MEFDRGKDKDILNLYNRNLKKSSDPIKVLICRKIQMKLQLSSKTNQEIILITNLNSSVFQQLKAPNPCN
jgi:hypothetical protein